jgi:hypothetical protein
MRKIFPGCWAWAMTVKVCSITAITMHVTAVFFTANLALGVFIALNEESRQLNF